jgi:hypothetical protein
LNTTNGTIEEISKIVDDTFNVWSNDVNNRQNVARPMWLYFNRHQPCLANTTIRLSWLFGAHGDNFAFVDNALMPTVLAHSFYPHTPLAGHIHFNALLKWTVHYTDFSRHFISNILLHELGHTLGLGHSSNPNAIMHNTYRRERYAQLNLDDICGLSSLYVGDSYLCLHIQRLATIATLPISDDESPNDNDLDFGNTTTLNSDEDGIELDGSDDTSDNLITNRTRRSRVYSDTLYSFLIQILNRLVWV